MLKLVKHHLRLHVNVMGELVRILLYKICILSRKEFEAKALHSSSVSAEILIIEKSVDATILARQMGVECLYGLCTRYIGHITTSSSHSLCSHGTDKAHLLIKC